MNCSSSEIAPHGYSIAAHIAYDMKNGNFPERSSISDFMEKNGPMTEVLSPAPEDLSPFAQGYVEAMLQPTEALYISLTDRFANFSDLAPETLARVMADCELRQKYDAAGVGYQRDDGAHFWAERQADNLAKYFPPLTVALCDDGKVRFA